MKSTFSGLVRELRTLCSSFDNESVRRALYLFRELKQTTFPRGQALLSYVDLLLFMSAYPGSGRVTTAIRSELARVTTHCKRLSKFSGALPINAGLPYADITTTFSPVFVRWLLEHPHCIAELDSFATDALSLNDVLNLSLPSLLRTETTAGRSNDELLATLGVPPSQRLGFLTQQMSRVSAVPALQDLLFEKLGVCVRLRPTMALFSRLHNRLSDHSNYIHTEILKTFDSNELISRPIPTASLLDTERKIELIRVVKNAMALSARETDPATFLDESSLRFFELERGLSIVLFGIQSERQLPLESYVGFTAFKNGLPCAYGGAWVFGRMANIGINVFEAFRGGESAVLMSQLLRVYKQVFDLTCFEVEPYQYGLNNPEGIESAAFWFYYRFGFRPADKTLARLAKDENDKRVKRRGYRSSKRTLNRFTESSMLLRFDSKVPTPVAKVSNAVMTMMNKRFDNDHTRAETECVTRFTKLTALQMPLNQEHLQVLTEVALWASAMNIENALQLDALMRMVELKPVDQYGYQQCVRQFFEAE